MAVTFNFKKMESTASALYFVEAVDDNGKVLLSWQIACDDETQLQSIAQEAYQLATTPTKY